MFFFLGVNSPGAEDSPTNHSPYFYVDDSALTNGLKAFINLVEDYSPSSIKIKTILSNGKYSKEYEILPDKWEKYDYQLVKDEEAKKDRYKPVVIGYFKQYPIRVARATTIHKSQGQTFDNVLVDFGSRGAFAHGQAYELRINIPLIFNINFYRHILCEVIYIIIAVY